MSLSHAYLDQVNAQLKAIAETQMAAVTRAAEWFADCLIRETWIYLFGTGHSHMLAEELFYRAGGLARIVPMLHEPFMLHQSASSSTERERDASLVPGLLEKYPMRAGDVLVVVSNSGRNAVPIELALRARERQVRVIALVNLRHAGQWASRHPSGRKLMEAADLVLDNCGLPGDACVVEPTLQMALGPTSTVTGCVLLQMIVCAAVENALARGGRPEVFRSSNVDGPDMNRQILSRYVGVIPHL
jgi:uncharacterized phosphosugar-binding protein